MATTRQPLQVFAAVEPHGDALSVVLFYDGVPDGVRFCFDDCEELAIDLACAVKHDGLPRVAADEALRKVRQVVGNYWDDDLFCDLNDGVGYGAGPRGAARHGSLGRRADFPWFLVAACLLSAAVWIGGAVVLWNLFD